MREEQEQAELLRRYVLGELVEAERQQLEERYFAEPELVLELNAVRTELLDAWASHTLPQTQQEQLERQMQKLPALRRQAEFALGWRDWLAASAVPTPQLAPTPAESIFSIFARWLVWLASNQAAPLWVGAGVLMILGLWFSAHNREPVKTPPSELARTESPSLGTASTPQPAPPVSPAPRVSHEAKTIATFFLTPSLTRAGLKAPEITLPAAAQVVRLQLEIEGSPDTRYTATLQSEQGEALWEKTGLVAQHSQGTKLVLLNLPASLLKPQAYSLRLRPRDSAQVLVTYYFRVVD